MTEVLAITAFLMAFGAVFLANDAVRKAENKNEAFIKNHVDKLLADIAQSNALIDELQSSLADQEQKLIADEGEVTAIKQKIVVLEKNLAQTNVDITELAMSSSRKAPRKKQ